MGASYYRAWPIELTVQECYGCYKLPSFRSEGFIFVRIVIGVLLKLVLLLQNKALKKTVVQNNRLF